MTRYLIIGNGVAAVSAAETVRRNDEAGSISMFSREPYTSYYRPALPEYLSGERGVREMTIHDQGWYAKRRIELHLQTEIAAIDPDLKQAVTSDGREFPYDKLLLATGGISFVPPIPGRDSEGVCTLRTIADADVIREKARESTNLVVIGGGLLGIEAGNGLRKTGLKVSVVEFFPRLLPRQLDPRGAALLQKQMEQMGFSFYLGCSTREILRADKGLTIRLADGQEIRADMVLLISAGVRPESRLAEALGLEMDKAVKVDDTLRTSRQDIYAAGDLVEHRGRYYGIWPAAQEQGRAAGAAMTGREVRYEGTVPSNKLKVAGIGLVATGEIDAEGKHEAVITEDAAAYVYRKIVLKNNAIVGAILLGDTRGDDAILNAIKKQKDVSAFKGELADRNFDLTRLRDSR